MALTGDLCQIAFKLFEVIDFRLNGQNVPFGHLGNLVARIITTVDCLEQATNIADGKPKLP